MLKSCGDNEEERSDLEAALDSMLSVLKYVNDIMHQVAITGFPVSLHFSFWSHYCVFICDYVRDATFLAKVCNDKL